MHQDSRSSDVTCNFSCTFHVFFGPGDVDPWVIPQLHDRVRSNTRDALTFATWELTLGEFDDAT